MAATTTIRRLLLPALNIKKTLGYTVLLPPKNLSCVTSQFCQFTSGTGLFAKKGKPLIQKAVKEKKSRRKSLTNHYSPARIGEPTRPNFILAKKIPNYFCNPETLTLDGYKFIEKTQLEEVTKGFKQYHNYDSYIMPDGNVSKLAKDKKNYEYKVSKKFYMDENDAKKRISVTNIEVLDTDLEHSSFKTHTLIYQYSSVPKGDPSEVPDVTEECIRTVEPVEALEKTLDQFKRTTCGSHLITKNDKEQYIRAKVENDNAVAMIQFSEYKHSYDNNIKAVNMQVTAFSGAKELKKLENLGFLQVYSKEKQVLIFIDKILAKMKTLEESDGGDFSLRALKDITDDKELKWLHAKQKFEYQKVDGKFKQIHVMKSRVEVPTSVDLVCQKHQFESKEDKDIKYYVLHIIETTDKELEPFIGKCLVQKKDEKHQTITIPEKVFQFMLANSDFVE